MFRTAPLSIISSFSPYTQQWCTSYSSFTNIYLLYLFYSKNKFEKSAHLVGFFIRIYHDARSPERQFFFDVLLTVHLSIFISVFNQLDAQNLFYNKFISCLYMFRARVLIIKRSKLHYTASGIITPIGDLLMMRTCARNM